MPLSGRQGDPVVVSWGGRRIDLFARSGDDRLHHWWTDNGDAYDGPPEFETWYGPEVLDGVLRSDPVAVCPESRRMHVFAAGQGGRLLHWWWDDGQGRMAGPEIRENWRLLRKPAVASWGPGRIDVFGRTTLGGLRRWGCEGNTWLEPDNYGNFGLTGDPTVVATGPGQLHVFARSRDGTLDYSRWDGQGVQESYRLGGGVFATPVAVSWDVDRLDVFAANQDDGNLHWGCNAPFTQERWFGPEANIPREMAIVDAAVTTGRQQIDVFGWGQAGELEQSWWDAPSRTWSGPGYRGGPLDRAPVPLAWTLGVDVFSRTADGGLQRWHMHNNLWYGPWRLRPNPVDDVEQPQATSWAAGVPVDPGYVLVRASDMAVLGVRWSRFELVDGRPGVLRATADDARVVLIFPPQHIGEEVAPPWQAGVALVPMLDPGITFGHRVWQARLAGASRIAFTVEAGTEIPLTVDGLLDALTLADVLPGSRNPADDLTAIELPWRLIMSPVDTKDPTEADEPGQVRCRHPVQPVELPTGAVGLWRTRLESTGAGMVLVGHDPGADDPFPVPLTRTGRRLVSAQDPPPDINRLELSALGGSLSASGTWDTVEWEHEAVLGRDQTVRLVARGVLYPFGHRAVYEEVSDRTFDPFDGDPVAVVRKRRTLTVTEPARHLTDPALLRTFPFTSVEITTLVYPDLPDPGSWDRVHQRMPVDLERLRAQLAQLEQDLERLLREVDADWVGGDIVVEAYAAEDEAAADYLRLFEDIETVREQITVLASTGAQVVDWYFWPERPAGRFVQFPVRATGKAGDVHFSLPMLFVADLDLPQTPIFEAFDSLADGVAGDIADEYASVAGPVDVPGVPIVLVHGGGDRPEPGDLHEVRRLNFSAGVSGRGFRPRLGRPGAPDGGDWAVEVALPALRTLLDHAEPARLRYTSGYEQRGATEDVAFQILDGVQASFAKKADRAGGLIAPTLALDAVSRTKGLANEAAVTALDPARLLAGTTLLGFDLTTLLADVTTVPDIVSTLSDDGLPVVRMSWTGVRLGHAPPFRHVDGRPPAELTMNVDNGTDRTLTTCTVSNFELAFPDGSPLLRLAFDAVTFTQENGNPPKLDVAAVDVVFEGDLDLLQVLQDNVDLGPAGATVDVTSTGIVARYVLPVPDVRAGAFVMQNLVFAAAVAVPFDTSGGQVMSVSLGFGSRAQPFNLSVLMLGGGGYVDVEIDHGGLRRLEICLEFGAMVAIDFLVATAEVHVLGGIRFTMLPDKSVVLTGFVRLGGSVDILGLVSISVELVVSLGYESAGNRLVGQATLVIELDLTLFSTSVELDSGVWEIAGGDPPPPPPPLPGAAAGAAFAAAAAPVVQVPLADWQAYRKAFTG